MGRLSVANAVQHQSITNDRTGGIGIDMLNWHSFGTKIEIGGGEGIILDVHLVSIYDQMLGEFWSH